MRLGKYLSSLTKPELEELKEYLNLTDDENDVFICLSKGKSKVKISEECKISVGTVSNRIKSISNKVERINSIERK